MVFFTDTVSRNSGNFLLTLRCTPEVRRPRFPGFILTCCCTGRLL